MEPFSRFKRLQNIELPDEFRKVLAERQPDEINGLVYRLMPPDDQPPSLAWALEAIRTAVSPPPDELVPLMPVDDRSFACVVCSVKNSHRPIDFGSVVRWHLDDVPSWAQRQLLDVTVCDYLNAVVYDLKAREKGLKLMEKIAGSYSTSHGKGPNRRRPRFFDERPIRLAVQNVIVGLAAYKYDSKFDALSVSAWQTCEVPHLGAHESTRGLAALTFGEAFQCGSTMEIRFDHHPENAIPARLKQFARTRGIVIGEEDKAAITPTESRKLIWTIPKISDSLRSTLVEISEKGLLSAERLCFSLLSGTWSSVALDFMLHYEPSTAIRILEGASNPTDWAGYRIDLGLARRAFLMEKFVERAFLPKEDSDSQVIAFEDDLSRLTWKISDTASIRMHITEDLLVPWIDTSIFADDIDIYSFDFMDLDEAGELAAKSTERITIAIVPQDVPTPKIDSNLVYFAHAPWTLEAIDHDLSKRFLQMKITRK